MELRHLRCFLALVEQGTFTRGAKKMKIVQSTFSLCIKEVEQELGAQLFERTTRRVEITPIGRLFVPHARSVLESLDAGIQAVLAESGVIRGRLRISILQSLEPYLSIPILLKSFHAAYPQVELVIQTLNDTVEIAPLIHAGDLDVGFFPLLDVRECAGLQRTAVVSDRLVAIAPRGHRLDGPASVTLRDLVDEPFVDLTTERRLRTLIDRCFAAHKLIRTTAFEMNDEPTAIQFVEAGLGVALMPSRLARHYARYRAICVVPLRPASAKLPKWKVVVLQRTQRPQAITQTLSALFVQSIQRTMREAKVQTPNSRLCCARTEESSP